MAGTLRELCIEEYQRYVRESDIDPELKRAFLKGERTPVMIDRLVADLSKCGNNIPKDSIVKAVRDVTRWTIQMVELKAKEMAMSDLAKRQMIAEQDKKRQFQKDVETLDEKGVMHVLETSESFEEERSEIGLRTREYRELAAEHPGTERTP